MLAFEQAVSLYGCAWPPLTRPTWAPPRRDSATGRSWAQPGRTPRSATTTQVPTRVQAAELGEKINDPMAVAEALFHFGFLPQPPTPSLLARLDTAVAALGEEHVVERLLLMVIRLVQEATWSSVGELEGLIARSDELIAEAREVGDARALGLAFMAAAHVRRGSPVEADGLRSARDARSSGDAIEMVPEFTAFYIAVGSAALGDRVGFDTARAEVERVGGRATGGLARSNAAVRLTRGSSGRSLGRRQSRSCRRARPRWSRDG